MDQLLGSIVLFAGNFAPTGWMICNGQELAITQYTALFSILGTNYGGDGTTKFNLPNLNGAALDTTKGAASPLFIICVEGIFPSRS